MKVIEIGMKDSGKCVLGICPGNRINDPADLVADMVRTMIEEDSIDETITVSMKEMSTEEFEALPEWEGW